MTLAKDDKDEGRDYRAEAKRWAEAIKDKDMREEAEEAAELVLRKGFTLPRISFIRVRSIRGNHVIARYREPLSFERSMGTIEINEHPDIKKAGGVKALEESSVRSGWYAQPNCVLHELGHMIDFWMRSTTINMDIGDRFDRLDEKAVAREVSRYAATQAVEFRAEVISSVLAGRTFGKDLLDAAYLDRYRSDERIDRIYRMGSGEVPNTSMVERRFGTMMEALFREGGDSLRIEILERPEVAGFIDSHAAVLDGAFERTEMSGKMRERLRESDWMFSGLKTFHELREAFPSLLDENGGRKPFERFLRDVRSIDATYNRNWLRSEYNFAGAAASMAARWESFEKDGGDYYLQYRTARDGHVRPDHAAMDGITLPADDPFWDANFPPNGWNCRCTVVQVLRDDSTPTDRDEAYRRAEEALRGDKRGMFRFNPGKEGRAFPAHNPYTTSRCSRCGKSKLNLAGDTVPDNELCQACQILRNMRAKEISERLGGADRKTLSQSVYKWADEHLPLVTLSNGDKSKRLIIDNADGSMIVNKPFFRETFSKNIRNREIARTMDIAIHIAEWLPEARLVRVEPGDHHDCEFRVYEAEYDGVTVVCKAKDQEERIVYTMRIKKDED